MAVIKSTHSAASSARPFSLADVESHARKLLLRARQEAEEIVAKAKEEAVAVRRSAKEAGTAEGLIEGKKSGLSQGLAEGSSAGRAEAFEGEKERLAGLLAALTNAIEQFDQSRESLLKQVEDDVLPLVIAIVEKVTGRLGGTDAGVTRRNVTEAVRLVASRGRVRIAIHPEQLTAVEQLAGELQQRWPSLHHVEVVADGAISPGGCRVATAGGEIDARLETQVNRIVEELAPAVAISADQPDKTQNNGQITSENTRHGDSTTPAAISDSEGALRDDKATRAHPQQN